VVLPCLCLEKTTRVGHKQIDIQWLHGPIHGTPLDCVWEKALTKAHTNWAGTREHFRYGDSPPQKIYGESTFLLYLSFLTIFLVFLRLAKCQRVASMKRTKTIFLYILSQYVFLQCASLALYAFLHYRCKHIKDMISCFSFSFSVKVV
jgi:hypothetical protein